MPSSLVLIISTVTFFASLLLPFAVRPLLVRLGVIDTPNARSSHEKPVLRGLGLAVLLALLLGGSIAVWQFYANGDSANGLLLLFLGLFGFLSGLLGLGEDLKGVSVKVRSVALLLIAGGAAFGAVWLGARPNAQNYLPGEPARYTDSAAMVSGTQLNLAELPVWALILVAIYGVFFISGFINVANFMDGLNGISALHAIIAGVTFFVTGWLVMMPWLAVAGALIATAFAGFLPWNLSRQGAFLGDVGSYLLGGSIAITSFAAFSAGVPFLATIGPMVIYFGDVVVTLVKRVRAGNRWDEPHKEHVYQRYQQGGRTHLQAALVVALFSAVASTLGVLSIFAPGFWWLAFLVAGVVVLLLYLRIAR